MEIFDPAAFKTVDGAVVPLVVYSRDGTRTVIGNAAIHVTEDGVDTDMSIAPEHEAYLTAVTSIPMGFGINARMPVERKSDH